MTELTTTRTTTLCALFRATAAKRGDQPALRTPDGSTTLTWTDYAEQVRAFAAGLHGIGVRRGDTVAFWMSNRPEFHVADAAALHLGAAAFSVSTLTPAQGEHVIADAGARILITEDAFLERALAVRDRGRTSLETVVLVGRGSDPRVLTWAEVLAFAAPCFDLDAAAVAPDDLATLIYTSGTTGAPKGVQLTHANIVSQLDAIRDVLQLPTGLRAISWLPMAHVAERLSTHYLAMADGSEVTTCSDRGRSPSSCSPSAPGSSSPRRGCVSVSSARVLEARPRRERPAPWR
jgi:long-chain acyl-CoA synthetase